MYNEAWFGACLILIFKRRAFRARRFNARGLGGGGTGQGGGYGFWVLLTKVANSYNI